MPPYRAGESKKDYYNRTINGLKDIANAITLGVPKEVIAVTPIVPSGEQDLKIPDPAACMKTDQKLAYDIWLELTYVGDDTYVFEVSRREQAKLVVTNSSPEQPPNADEVRKLLANIGRQIAGQTVQSRISTPVPLKGVSLPRSGVIFLYDSSSSMYETDRDARNRSRVMSTIGAILAQAGSTPIPFAAVMFADDAQILDNGSGSSWFQTTPTDLAIASAKLGSARKDMGNTDIGAAFDAAASLINARNDIQRWHTVFLTDGVPTKRTTDYKDITARVTAALGGKSTLSVIALHGIDPTHTEDAKLAQLVRAVIDGTGQSGEIVHLRINETPDSFHRGIERIAFLINRSTIRDEVILSCLNDVGNRQIECGLDPGQPHALRFGASRKVTFVADATGFPHGRCIARIENQGLGSMPLLLELPEGQSRRTASQAGFTITFSRVENWVTLTIDLLKGRLNGDWKINFTISEATRHAAAGQRAATQGAP